MNICFKLFILGFLLAFTNCRKALNVKKAIENSILEVEIKPQYAKGFSVFKTEHYIKIKLYKPWPGATDTLSYFLIPKNEEKPILLKGSKIIKTPISKIISCSTTDIPYLEALKVENSLIGFPEHKYISSVKTRKRIDNNLVTDIGNISQLNTEMILELQPEIIIGFSSNSKNNAFDLLERSGINTLMNGSWLESHPLGRAEWIKVYGYLFNKEKEASLYFKEIEKNYNEALMLAQQAIKKPTILSGNMYKDIWYVPGGNSYAAKLIADANGDYLWKNNTDTGSLSLSFESVYDKAANADIWIGAGKFSTLGELVNFEEKYQLFKACKNNYVFSKDLKKGSTGGILYYEQGALNADWVLEDLIQIFHPNLVSNYTPHFYTKLN